MKTCPFCAEEIQPAAIVCKHCRRDLVPAVPMPAVKAGPRWGRIVLAVIVLLGAFVWTLSFVGGSPELEAFRTQRAAWHRKCDLYIDVPTARLDAAGRACGRELEEMMAHAKRQGW